MRVQIPEEEKKLLLLLIIISDEVFQDKKIWKEVETAWNILMSTILEEN